ncbi:MAG: amidase domain-containing protein [Clostridia bacterium]|nr:amidase domain-containing protein [Clostridia bacterium]
MTDIVYNREAAVRYAREWAFGRNPAYYDFSELGGDCTNFASQCLFAGCGVMNYTPTFGWYYRSVNDRAPAWTGVKELYRFLVNNDGAGPFAREVAAGEAMPGDLVQLGDRNGGFYHTPVIIATEPEILVAAHSYDALDRPLSSYFAFSYRFLHIEGARR